ncbi:hypothetical protein MKX03_029159 [Papaver bracteatum]|nr:hypothetical protein MKX03_029159 [Papaver bracteatum]
MKLDNHMTKTDCLAHQYLYLSAIHIQTTWDLTLGNTTVDIHRGASNGHDQSNRGDAVATRRPYNHRDSTSLPELCKRKKFGDSNPVILVNPHPKFVGLHIREFSLSIGMWVR